jgi:hypothetical protein
MDGWGINLGGWMGRMNIALWGLGSYVGCGFGLSNL